VAAANDRRTRTVTGGRLPNLGAEATQTYFCFAGLSGSKLRIGAHLIEAKPRDIFGPSA